MRLYSLTNKYLSGIQKGIQTAHAVAELVKLYVLDNEEIPSRQVQMVEEWVDKHKTIIVLEGGSCAELRAAMEIVSSQDLYPWWSFCEDGDSLDGALTTVVMVLPESVYKWKNYSEYVDMLCSNKKLDDGTGEYLRLISRRLAV